MASHINVITLAAQEDVNALAKAYASALANAVGWVLDTDEVTVRVSAAHDIGVRFVVTNGYVYPVIINSDGYSGADTYSSVRYNSTSTYKIYWVKTSAGTVAFGIDSGTNILPTLSIVVGKNSSGIWSAIDMQGSSGATPYPVVRTTTQGGGKTFNLSLNYALDRPLALVRLPDMVNGGMFVDIYAVLSSPTKETTELYRIGDQYFRPIKINNGNSDSAMLAVPV